MARHTPPVVFFLNTMSGLLLFKRIPTASSSCSRRCLCSSDFVASNIIKMRSAVFAAMIKVLTQNPDAKKEKRRLTGDYLSSTTATLACTLDDTRKIKQLDSCTFIFNHAWNCLKYIVNTAGLRGRVIEIPSGS